MKRLPEAQVVHMPYKPRPKGSIKSGRITPSSTCLVSRSIDSFAQTCLGFGLACDLLHAGCEHRVEPKVHEQVHEVDRWQLTFLARRDECTIFQVRNLHPQKSFEKKPARFFTSK